MNMAQYFFTDPSSFVNSKLAMRDTICIFSRTRQSKQIVFSVSGILDKCV